MTVFEEFVAPWRTAFPALALAELYSDGDAEAARLLARAVLVMECCDAVWRASDERVTAAKLGWWVEEWERIIEGAGRHPIAQALRPAPVPAPFAPLLRELDPVRMGDWGERRNAYAAIGDEFARALPSNEAMPEEADAQAASSLCWLSLVASRHLAAVWANSAAAMAGLPMDARARHQLRSDAADAGAAKMAAEEGAQFMAQSLASAFDALPAQAWIGLRGARVLTLIAFRELAALGQRPSRLDAWRNAFAAWRAARVVPANRA